MAQSNKYRLKNLPDGQEKVFPALRIKVSNETLTDAVAELLIKKGFGNEIEEVKSSGKSEAKA